ncbi:SDR family NAD(P)-dependent oxidoreductase [Renibacterium salmoninarum]|uniref:SDR family NAD(P)-dependent oxidoreductase n=1 Tax=Renibacterium salmoninarum TaxID=1646 RepID=UPI0002F082D2
MLVAGCWLLVAGCTGGPGASRVRAYYQEGANVLIAGTSEGPGKELATELGERALFARLDVTDEEA